MHTRGTCIRKSRVRMYVPFHFYFQRRRTVNPKFILFLVAAGCFLGALISGLMGNTTLLWIFNIAGVVVSVFLAYTIFKDRGGFTQF